MDSFPPPHRVFYEPLNDIETGKVWNAYKIQHEHEADFEEVDAADMNGMEDFAKWFNQWITFVPSRVTSRVRVLIIWHAHFLSLACQQMLRRSLEQRSFRCRVWFHIEEPSLQAAIVSRCIVKTMPRYSHLPRIIGSRVDTRLWTDPRKYKTDILVSKE
jgi:hypothetical protein